MSAAVASPLGGGVCVASIGRGTGEARRSRTQQARFLRRLRLHIMNASEFETELLLEAERKRNTMPLFARNVIGLVLAIAAIILLGSGFLIAVAIGRRFERERYFRRLDALRAQYGPAVSALLAGRLDHKSVLNRLRSISGPDRVFLVERLCLEQKPTPAQRPVLRRLCEDLGLVEVWRRGLAAACAWWAVRDCVC